MFRFHTQLPRHSRRPVVPFSGRLSYPLVSSLSWGAYGSICFAFSAFVSWKYSIKIILQTPLVRTVRFSEPSLSSRFGCGCAVIHTSVQTNKDALKWAPTRADISGTCHPSRLPMLPLSTDVCLILPSKCLLHLNRSITPPTHLYWETLYMFYAFTQNSHGYFWGRY